MNSDKLDKYFKEQIDSLKTLPVPGTKWNREASWDKIDQQVGDRRKVVFWWYLSGAAAIVIIFLSFWFSRFDSTSNKNPMAEQILELPAENEVGHFAENIISSEAVAEKENKIIEDIADKSIVVGKNHEAENQVPKNKRHSLVVINHLAYLPEQLSINQSEIQFQKPEPKKSNTESSSEQEIAIAFNRTYIIRSKNKDVAKEKNNGVELKLRIDLAMRSEADPPSGILSNRGR